MDDILNNFHVPLLVLWPLLRLDNDRRTCLKSLFGFPESVKYEDQSKNRDRLFFLAIAKIILRKLEVVTDKFVDATREIRVSYKRISCVASICF